jgi:hypothetical protein
VAVPETAVNKYRDSMPRQHDVRFAGQLLAVQAISKAASVKATAQQALGLGVSCPNSSHHSTTYIFADGIYHSQSSC